MIQMFFNGIIYMMLTKFITNDLSHMLNVSLWVDPAWQKLCVFYRERAFGLKDLDELYRATVERRMPKGTLSPGAEAFLENWQTHVTVSPLPGMKVGSSEQLRKLKTVLAGYHLIALGEAPDVVVNDVFDIVKVELGLEDEEGEPEDQWWVDIINKAKDSLRTAETRADKVFAIDRVLSIAHQYEARWLASDYFGGIDSTPIDLGLRQLFEMWFGAAPYGTEEEFMEFLVGGEE